MRVQIGNSAAKEAWRDADDVLHHRDLDGQRVTVISIPGTYTLLEAVQVVTAADGVWNNHSQGDAVTDSTPDWVEADNEALAMLLGAALKCPVGRPNGWQESYDNAPSTGEDEA